MIRLSWSRVLTAVLVLALGVGTTGHSPLPDRADAGAGVSGDTNWGWHRG